MNYPKDLNSKYFIALAAAIEAKVREEYGNLGETGFNWLRIQRVSSYLDELRGEDGVISKEYSLTYFLVRDLAVFEYLIDHYKHKKPSLVKELKKHKEKALPKPEFYSILQDLISDVYLYNRKPNAANVYKLGEPYNAIFPIYANIPPYKKGEELPAKLAKFLPKERIDLEKHQKEDLAFEVLYKSAKTGKVDSFELGFDVKKEKVYADGFHKPLDKRYTMKEFQIPEGSHKLILDLVREKSNDNLHLDVNLGSFDLRESNYFSGTYIGTSFTTGKSISGTIYLLRKQFISNGYNEDRENCRLRLEQKLNLGPASRIVDILNPSDFQKNKQAKKNREEVLEDYAGVYLAGSREKRKKGKGNFMRVALFTLKKELVGSFQLPGQEAIEAYVCSIGFSETTFETEPPQIMSLTLSFDHPNDPFMNAMIGVPSEDSEGDMRKLKGHFSRVKEGGGLVLFRLEDGAPATPEIVNMDTNDFDKYDEMWNMLEILNSPYSE